MLLIIKPFLVEIRNFNINTELDDFVDMVFDQLETAKNYVRKMYRMFVRSEWGQDVEDDIITPLAQQLKN